MARGLANVERNIEQLKANQQQIASDNSKAIEELQGEPGKEIKRVAREGFRAEPRPRRHRLRRSRPRPLRKPERTLPSPAREKPRPSNSKGVDLRGPGSRRLR